MESMTVKDTLTGDTLRVVYLEGRKDPVVWVGDEAEPQAVKNRSLGKFIRIWMRTRKNK